jgi:hypothetical protein
MSGAASARRCGRREAGEAQRVADVPFVADLGVVKRHDRVGAGNAFGSEVGIIGVRFGGVARERLNRSRIQLTAWRCSRKHGHPSSSPRGLPTAQGPALIRSMSSKP